MKEKKISKMGKCMMFILLMIPATAILVILAGIGAILDTLLREGKRSPRLIPKGMKSRKNP